MGNMKLENRVVMAPLTRCRAIEGSDHVPSDLMVEYYAQRASPGSLLIAEATMIAEGQSTFWNEPGIYSAEQVAAWKKVVDAVHAKGGCIYLQIWHGGRSCHPKNSASSAWDCLPEDKRPKNRSLDGNQPVAPSPIRIEGNQLRSFFNPTDEPLDFVMPRTLSVSEIESDIIGGFVKAAKNAVDGAGFDGVEIHAANGYLIDSFLRSSSNQRPVKTLDGQEDPYNGQSIPSRCKILLDIVRKIGLALGDGEDVESGLKKVGVRLSPLNSFQDMEDADPLALTTYLCTELGKLGPLSFLHMMRGDFLKKQSGDVVTIARKFFQHINSDGSTRPGVLMTNMDYSATEANTAIESGVVDCVAFGKAFITNPDLVQRFQMRGDPKFEGEDPPYLLYSTPPRMDKYYTHGAEGYVDYPFMPTS